MSDTLLVDESAEERGVVEKRRITPAVLTVLGVVATIESVRLGLGDPTEPGPGAWPLLASVGVLVTSVWLFITGVERCEKVVLSDLARVATAIASVAFFVVMFPLVGMPVPAFVLLVVWLRLFGESWRLTLVTAGLAVVALQIVFVELLGVPFPIGPLAPGR